MLHADPNVLQNVKPTQQPPYSQRNPYEKQPYFTGDKKLRGNYSCTDWCTKTGKHGRQILNDLDYYTKLIEGRDNNHAFIKKDKPAFAETLPQKVCTDKDRTMVGSFYWCDRYCKTEGGGLTRFKNQFRGKDRKDKVLDYTIALMAACTKYANATKEFEVPSIIQD